MDRSALEELPTETICHIGRYLNAYDRVLLGLTCRRFYSLFTAGTDTSHDDKLIYFLRPSCKNQRYRTRLWLVRMNFLHCLDSWLQRVDQQAQCSDWDNPHTKQLALCIGCAQYRYFDDDWEDGDTYGDICYDDSQLWRAVRAYVIEGQFCSQCRPAWTDLTSGVLSGGTYLRFQVSSTGQLAQGSQNPTKIALFLVPSAHTTKPLSITSSESGARTPGFLRPDPDRWESQVFLEI